MNNIFLVIETRIIFLIFGKWFVHLQFFIKIILILQIKNIIKIVWKWHLFLIKRNSIVFNQTSEFAKIKSWRWRIFFVCWVLCLSVIHFSTILSAFYLLINFLWLFIIVLSFTIYRIFFLILNLVKILLNIIYILLFFYLKLYAVHNKILDFLLLWLRSKL